MDKSKKDSVGSVGSVTSHKSSYDKIEVKSENTNCSV